MEFAKHFISIEVCNELERRKEKNTRYSLRAYAKHLKMEPSLLSKIIRGKVVPSSRTVAKLVSSFGIDEEKKASLLKKYKSDKDDKTFKYQQGKSSFLKVKSSDESIFGSWNELVVFSTLGLKQKSTLEDISRRLDVSISELDNILFQLKKKGLIDKEGHFFSLRVNQIADEVPVISNELKKDIQKKFLAEAIKKIDEVDIEDRLNGTLTFPLDKKLLPKVKQKIANFMAELNGVSTSKSTRVTDVYNLTLALYPLRKDFV